MHSRLYLARDAFANAFRVSVEVACTESYWLKEKNKDSGRGKARPVERKSRMLLYFFFRGTKIMQIAQDVIAILNVLKYTYIHIYSFYT